MEDARVDYHAKSDESSTGWRHSGFRRPSASHPKRGTDSASPWPARSTMLSTMSLDAPYIEPMSLVNPRLTLGSTIDERSAHDHHSLRHFPGLDDAASTSSRYSTDPPRGESRDSVELSALPTSPRGQIGQALSTGQTYAHEEDGTLGLVQSIPSQRHSRSSMKPQSLSARSATRRPLSGRFHHRWTAEAQSRRDMRRTSSTILALPAMPAGLGSSAGTPPAVSHSSVDLEKWTAAMRSPVAPARESEVVSWDGPDDPGGSPPQAAVRGDPLLMSWSKKWATTFALGFVTFCVTFASSVFSPGTQQAAREFEVSSEVMVLGTSLFVLGFVFGPIIWGPASEVYGRKLPLFIGFVVFGIFQVPVAVAQNVETIFVCRFVAGFFGCAPLVVVGGALADFWAPVDRGVAVSIFSGATFLGPTGGPIVGGYLVETLGLGWRWTAWITLCAVAVFGTIGWFVIDESWGPVLLQRRARKLRYATKNWAIHAPADEIEIELSAILSKYCTKPIMMLIWEPILLLITIYISFIYGILYLFFETYPISFIEQRGWALGAGGLPFLAVMAGVVLGGVVNFLFIRTRYVRILRQHGRVPPEERLVPMMVGAVALPAGLFCFAWTSRPEITPIPQIVSGVPVGMGIVLIFLQGINYIIDVYLMHANSAIAGNTVIRSLFGAAFPMFATYMYRALGVQWATSVLGFVAVGLIPVPMLFFVYGARIRKLTRFTPKFPPGMGPGGPPPGGMAGGAPPGRGMSGGPPGA
ncbi:hypothetical protein LTR53_008552 [Teratosphaeriaceae sp. CCFEE 6253]|nr:hypothetical protein LTR53_008552 [Teratosphaeriaceae sp. CCFEE 6253]